MSPLKTLKNDASVHDFILKATTTEQKRSDAFALLAFMKECTGYEPVMWGLTIIGFGEYFYKSERSKQEGYWPLAFFSPRKSSISLYVYTPSEEQKKLLGLLGKFKMGKSCIYVNKLSDIHLDILKEIILNSISYLKR